MVLLAPRARAALEVSADLRTALVDRTSEALVRDVDDERRALLDVAMAIELHERQVTDPLDESLRVVT